MAVIDTTFLVALEKGSPAAKALNAEIRSSGQARRIPAAVWVEYLTGFPPMDRDNGQRALEGGGTFEAFTRNLADEAARLQFDLLRAGEPLAWHDLQIATTALHYGEPLITSDARFDGVPGLAVVAHG